MRYLRRVRYQVSKDKQVLANKAEVLELLARTKLAGISQMIKDGSYCTANELSKLTELMQSALLELQESEELVRKVFARIAKKKRTKNA